MFSPGKGLRPSENNPIVSAVAMYDRNESYAASCTSHCVIRRRRIRLIIIIAAARNHCARRQWFLQQIRPTVVYIVLYIYT